MSLTSTLCKIQKIYIKAEELFDTKNQSLTMLLPESLWGRVAWNKTWKDFIRVSNFINRHQPVAKSMSASVSSRWVGSDIFSLNCTLLLAQSGALTVMLHRYRPNQFFRQFSLSLTPQCHSSQIAKASPMQLRAIHAMYSWRSAPMCPKMLWLCLPLLRLFPQIEDGIVLLHVGPQKVKDQ